MRRRIVVWILFGVVGGLTPLYLISSQRASTGEPSSIVDVIATGELILISAVLAIGSIGELLANAKSRLSLYAIFNVVCAISVLFGGALFYARIKSAEYWSVRWNDPTTMPRHAIPAPPDHIFGWSVTAFVVSLVIGVSIIWIITLGEQSNDD